MDRISVAIEAVKVRHLISNEKSELKRLEMLSSNRPSNPSFSLSSPHPHAHTHLTQKGKKKKKLHACPSQ